MIGVGNIMFRLKLAKSVLSWPSQHEVGKDQYENK